MHSQFFQHYIEPLTNWLHSHPDAALLITFLVAFTESLAIIGSIIPGSITMTAIGILAGSGIFRIDLTMIAASLGAIAGDGASYLLGYYFRDRLVQIWPFSRFPNLLAYGQVYFEKHGGKSVLIGRFVGPLRSIIPVIAGMMDMEKMRFFVANAVSGVAWALLYITPGVLIGAASHELSPEKATQFVLFILLGLISIWLLSICIKMIFLRCRNWFDRHLHRGWSSLLSTPIIGKLAWWITPKHAINHTQTALLFLFLILSLACLSMLTMVHHDGETLFLINQPIHVSLQSMRTQAFDFFFALAREVMTLIPIAALYLYMLLFTAKQRDYTGLFLWVCMLFLSLIAVHFYQSLLHSSIVIKPAGILENLNDCFYPFRSVSLGTAIYLTLLYHNHWVPHSISRRFFSCLLMLGLCFGSVSFVYLGDLWFTDLLAALSMGILLSLVYWLIYRKTHSFFRVAPPVFSLIGSLTFIISISFACYLHTEQTLQNHQIYFKQHVLSKSIWWDQQEPLLPVYSRNRVGRITSVFNVQYAGQLKPLRQSLEKMGWKKQKSSLFHIVIKEVQGRVHIENPLSNSLYLHRKPTLTLIYHPNHSSETIRLQLWRSNYYLQSFSQPIWLGHVQLLNRSLNRALYAQDPALPPLKRALMHFLTKVIVLPTSGVHRHSLIKANYLLLIRPKPVEKH